MGATPVDVFQFDNDEQRDRYRALIEELRCPKCLNINIAGSDAPIAQDLRRAVHRLVVVEGKSDQEVLDYMHARYGDFVLYDPPLSSRTALIWILPVIVAGIALVVLIWFVVRRKQSSAAMSASEKDALAELLGRDRGE